MAIFYSTLNQMAFLLLLIVIGFIVTRLGVIDSGAAKLLSKLENNIFIPALVFSTFMKNLTVDNIETAGKFILCGFVVVMALIPIALISARCCAKDLFIRKMYTYGLAFPNFGYMGNAVVSAIFPSLFLQYLIFVLPFWVAIYLWGVPVLLIPNEGKKSFLNSLKAFVNPMFISLIIGAVLGLTSFPVPTFIKSAATVLGDCMSPVAMLLIGITVANIKIKPILKNVSIYVITFIKLIVMPIIAIVALKLLSVPYPLALCSICAVAMPLGLNTIVIPSAYGKDTSVAAGIALISHIFSCITIPVIFYIFEKII